MHGESSMFCGESRETELVSGLLCNCGADLVLRVKVTTMVWGINWCC